MGNCGARKTSKVVGLNICRIGRLAQLPAIVAHHLAECFRDDAGASLSTQTCFGGVLGGNLAFYTMITRTTYPEVPVQSIKWRRT